MLRKNANKVEYKVVWAGKLTNKVERIDSLMTRKGIMYLRVAGNGSEYGIERQKVEIENFAKNQGIEIIKQYIDNGYPATTQKRPALYELLNSTGSLEIEKLLVYNYDRLSRNSFELWAIKEQLEKKGIELVSVIGGKDLFQLVDLPNLISKS